MLLHQYHYGIIVIEGAIESSICDQVVDSYLVSEQKAFLANHQTLDYPLGTQYLEKTFTVEKEGQFEKHFTQHIIQLRKAYFESLGLPDNELICSFTPPLIKQYRSDKNDKFLVHFDADQDTLQRALAMIWYLNGVEEGGETHFPYLDVTVNPTKGSCLIFPPYWNYMHQAKPPKSNDKFTLNCFGHLDSYPN